MNVLERVMKLIALASSPVEEEARTSAWLACKMIRENGLKLVERLPPPRTTWTPPPYRPPPPPPRPSPKDNDERVITSKFEGWCRECRSVIEVGQKIRWKKGEGARHVNCH